MAAIIVGAQDRSMLSKTPQYDAKDADVGYSVIQSCKKLFMNEMEIAMWTLVYEARVDRPGPLSLWLDLTALQAKVAVPSTRLGSPERPQGFR